MALRTRISPSRKGTTPSRNGNKVHYSASRNGSKPIKWRFIINILLGSVQSPSQLFSWYQWEVFNLSLVISAEQYNQWGRVTKTPYRVRPKLQWTNCCRSPALISSTSRSHSIQLQLSKFLTSPKLPCSNHTTMAATLCYWSTSKEASSSMVAFIRVFINTTSWWTIVSLYYICILKYLEANMAYCVIAPIPHFPLMHTYKPATLPHQHAVFVTW